MVLSYICFMIGTSLALGALAAAQSPQPPSRFTAEAGGFQSRYDHALWQSPDVVLSALHSKTDTIRLNAFHLLGAEGEDAYELLHGKNGDSKIIATPWESFLRYVALGEDGAQEAVLAVRVRNLILIAVAMPQNGKWNRIASFKFISYGAADGGDPLGTTVTFGRFTATTYDVHDLVLRVSEFPESNGIVSPYDDYVQHESHFRVYGGSLRRTIAFDRRNQTCGPGGQNTCDLTRRWFYFYRFGPLSTIPGGILVEAKGSAANLPSDYALRTAIEDRNLNFISCSTLLFNDKTHEFEKAPLPPSSTDPCREFLQRRPSTPRQ